MVQPAVRKRRRSRYRFRETRPSSLRRLQQNDLVATRGALPNNSAAISMQAVPAVSRPIDDPCVQNPSTDDQINYRAEQDGVERNNEDEVSAHQATSHAEDRILDVFRDNSSDNLCDMEDEENVAASEEMTRAVPNSEGSELRLAELELGFPYNSEDLRLGNWRILWALLVTNGSKKMSKIQYQSVRNLTEALGTTGRQHWKNFNLFFGSSEKAGTIRSIPHYSTLQRAYRPLLLRHLAVRSHQSLEPMDTSKAGARAVRFSPEGNPLSLLQIIPPSEYASIDMATGPVWEEMKSTSLRNNFSDGQRPAVSTSDCVDIWPVIAARELFYGPRKLLSVDKDLSSEITGMGFALDAPVATPPSKFAEFGDVLHVKVLRTRSPLTERLERCFGVPDPSTSDTYALRGTVSHVWTVHHACRRHDLLCKESYHPDTPERDTSLSDALNFVIYTSPTDSVDVEIPDLPERLEEDLRDNQGDGNRAGKMNKSPEMIEAIRRRRAAINEKTKKLEEAWKNWSKPPLKPGDLVVHLRPCAEGDLARHGSNLRENSTLLTSTDRSSRLFLVYRFWVENEERSRHILWIPGGDCASPDAVFRPLHVSGQSQRYLDVLQVLLIHCHAGPRGLDRYSATSSVGVLENGENYFVYRFALYWDGFEIQSGKSASGEGFYLLPLNLPVTARSSPHAVRVIALTPPGVKGDAVFRLILQDIIDGMTEGFLDIDADGNQRRIFLDLIGLVGDTPALNGELDVLGHTASACCHLCRFWRVAQCLFGSRYSAEHIHGMISQAARGLYQHMAVHDSNAEQETCRLLGIKPRGPAHPMVLNELQRSMFSARTRVPRTEYGVPVVPYHFDPYRASFVAPDHLLTGHAKDCINLVLQLLPSREYRQTCELYMIDFLKSSNLPTQNRLVNMDTKCLYSMSMSELYALSIVARTAFIVGCCTEDKRSRRAGSVSKQCIAAIALVGSSSSLIAALWRLPELERDGFRAVQDFNHHGGRFTIYKLQEQTVQHLKTVSAICNMDDNEYLQMEDEECNAQRKAELVKKYRASLVAVKTIDKPNVHRILELVFTTLPLVGHVGRIGELVLEKSHQGLKRAIRQSNQKDIQIQCMQGLAINDWQGRLTVLISEALEGDEVALRGCYSLLAGRDRLRAINGSPSPTISQKVLEALGPGQCLENELKMQGQSVLSPRTSANSQNVFWSLRENLLFVPHNSLPEQPSRRNIIQRFRACILPNARTYTIRIAERITANYGNGSDTAVTNLTKGDVIEVVTVDPTLPENHNPRLIQVSRVDDFQFASNTGPSLWCALGFLVVERETGVTSAYAALLPCISSEINASALSDSPPPSTWKVSLSSPVSFAVMDASIRRAGVLHACTSTSCQASASPRTWT